MIKNETPLEAEEQRLFCDYLTSKNIMFTSTQNGVVLGGKNKFAQLKKLKATGLQNGFPDLAVLARNKSKTSEIILIEMKRQKGSAISQEQKEWIEKLSDNGYSVGIAKGCESAIKILNNYLNS